MKKLFIIFLLLLLLILGYVLGTMQGSYLTEKKYKNILENDLSYCVYGAEIHHNTRVHKIKINEEKNEYR